MFNDNQHLMATLRFYLSEFERQLRLRNLALNTIDTYSNCVKMCIAKIYKDPSVISQQDVENYLLTLNSTKYKLQTIYAMQKFYKCVMKMPNHLKDLPAPKQEKYIPNTLNAQEVYRIVNSIQNLKHRAIIQLIYACGLRIGEVVNIKITDIDGVKMQLHIRQSKGAKDRIVPIPAQTLNMLRMYYKEYKPKNYLFDGQQSEKYSERSIQQIFKSACKTARIYKKVTVHSLRHSRATHLVDNGIDMSMIQKFLGHAHIKTTVDFYLHTSITTMQNLFAHADAKTLQSISFNNQTIQLNQCKTTTHF